MMFGDLTLTDGCQPRLVYEPVPSIGQQGKPLHRIAIEKWKFSASPYVQDKTFQLDLRFGSAYSDLCVGKHQPLYKPKHGVESSLFSKLGFRPVDSTPTIKAAMPVTGVLERKGVNSHGKGEGVYRND
jgi:hypothetical protein